MSKFREIVLKALNEAKQRGNLYHTTSFEALKNILKTNKLISDRPIGISTSRSSNIDYLFGGGVIIVLDGDKLSEKYKIFPFSYRGEDAREEVIQTNKNLPKYWKTPEHNNVFLSIIRNMEYEAPENEFYDTGSVLPNVLKYIKEIRLSKKYYTKKYIDELQKICIKNNNTCPPIVPLREYDNKKNNNFFRKDKPEYNAINQLNIFNAKDLTDLDNDFSRANYNLSQELNNLNQKK